MKKIISASAGLMLAAALASPASAQETSDVYVLHGIPGVTVDVYVNGDLTLEDFAPDTIAGPLALPAATYQIEIFAADADPEADTPVIDVSPAVPAGESVSVIAHLSESGDPTLSAFVNDLSNTAAGNARVTIRHTAAAPAVDIVAAGAPVAGFTNLSNPNEAVGEVPAGTYPTGIAATGTTEVLFDAPLTVAEGTNTVVYAIGDLAGGSFGLLVQSFDGLHSAPAAVNTGNSGLLAESEGSNSALVFGGLAALAGAGLLLSVPALRARRVRV